MRPKKIRILVVDDEQGMLEVISDTLRNLEGVELILETDSAKAAQRISAESFDLLITDIRMPGMDGVELLRRARKEDPEIAVLMVTAFPKLDSAVESMKLGASDYITKPFQPKDLEFTVRRILQHRTLKRENRILSRHLQKAYFKDDMVGESDPLQRVREDIRKITDSDVDVLILGETGTGKELVARAIHKGAAEKGGKFVPVDCGAIPEDLLESEMFGHEKGAFTGAYVRSLGLLELAEGGTFFLDEITELSLKLQAKLLRMLQERRFRRVGGKDEIAVKTRIVAATNRDPLLAVKEGRFREDLFYRINVARIEVPPLRERTGDIPLLVEHFVKLLALDAGGRDIELTSEAMDILVRYPWPGNVRELQNVIKRAVVMRGEGSIGVDGFPDDIIIRAASSSAGSVGGFFDLRQRRIEAFEKEYFSQLLDAHGGDMTKIAEKAQIPRGTLYRLLKNAGLKPDDFRA